MRRALLSALGIAALALSVPGAALAHGGHHRKNKSKAHHARVRFEHIGAPSGAPEPGARSTNEPTKPPAEPTASSDETAGKIASFTEGMLTITLNDGSTVSGKVTSRTEIECDKAPTATPEGTSSEDKGSGDDTSEGDKSSDDTEGDKSAEDSSQGTKEDGEDGEPAAPATSEPPCDSSALTIGAVVREAELRISSLSGAEFESIQLVR